MHRKIIGILGLLIASCVAGNAQRQDTIYQTLASNYISPNAPNVGDTWGPVTNIGQAFHQAYLNISPQSGKTCHSGTNTPSNDYTRMIFQTQIPGQLAQTIFNYTYSYTSVNPVGIASQMVMSTVANHPYVYIHVTGVDNINCQYTLIYTGSLYPGTVSYPASFLLLTGTINTSGTLVPVGSCCLILDVLSLQISNAVANQTVSLSCGGTVILQYNNLAAGQIVNSPFADVTRPYMVCFNDNFNITLANATNVSYSINYLYR